MSGIWSAKDREKMYPMYIGGYDPFEKNSLENRLRYHKRKYIDGNITSQEYLNRTRIEREKFNERRLAEAQAENTNNQQIENNMNPIIDTNATAELCKTVSKIVEDYRNDSNLNDKAKLESKKIEAELTKDAIKDAKNLVYVELDDYGDYSRAYVKRLDDDKLKEEVTKIQKEIVERNSKEKIENLELRLNSAKSQLKQYERNERSLRDSLRREEKHSENITLMKDDYSFQIDMLKKELGASMEKNLNSKKAQMLINYVASDSSTIKYTCDKVSTAIQMLEKLTEWTDCRAMGWIGSKIFKKINGKLVNYLIDLRWSLIQMKKKMESLSMAFSDIENLKDEIDDINWNNTIGAIQLSKKAKKLAA